MSRIEPIRQDEDAPPLVISRNSPFYGLAHAFGGLHPRRRRRAARAGDTVARALFLGLVSAVLYATLFLFQDDLVHLAELTQRGEKLYFALPIGVALTFSWVHGSFTGAFWSALGLKPKHDNHHKPRSGAQDTTHH